MRQHQTEVTELKDTISELKNTLIAFNSRIDQQINKQEDKIVGLTQTKQHFFLKALLKVIIYGTSGTILFAL